MACSLFIGRMLALELQATREHGSGSAATEAGWVRSTASLPVGTSGGMEGMVAS